MIIEPESLVAADQRAVLARSNAAVRQTLEPLLTQNGNRNYAPQAVLQAASGEMVLPA
ncbi:hypothetical protein [Ottowia oryzae]